MTLLPVLVFVCATAMVLALTWLMLDACNHSRKQLSGRIQELTDDKHENLSGKNLLFQDGFHGTDQRSFWRRFQYQARKVLSQAGIFCSVEIFLLLIVILTAIVAMTTYYFTEQTSLTVLAGMGVFVSSLLFVWRQYVARNMLIVQQLPEAFDLMARTIRAGQTVPSAMRLVSSNVPAPLSSYFRTCCDQQALGIPFDKSVEELARNINVLESRMFCVALLMQRQAGGNPAEMMEKLARVMRRRLALQAKVKALTSEGRMQAVALTLLPIGSFIMISVIDPEYSGRILAIPWLFWGTTCSMILGSLWIQKIISIEY